MKFIPSKIKDVIVIEPKLFRDARGFFYESYSKELFAKNGISAEFVQDNRSLSALGVLRGLHYQMAPKAQAKLVWVTRGEAFDVVVDIRKASKTFGHHVAEILSAENKKMIYIPEGFAHGFCALTEDTEFSYKVSDYYSPEHERGIRWDDPKIAIAWPKIKGGYLVSDKDKKFPVLS